MTNNLVTKVNKTGDTLTGPLYMGENKISSSYIPFDEYDLVNKKYIDALTTGETSSLVLASKLDSKLDKTGGILTGSLDIGPNKIMCSYTPRDALDLTNKAYVDNGLAHRLDDEDMRMITNNLSLKLNKTDIRYVRNAVGYVPNLDKNEDKSGYIVTASSEHSRLTLAYFTFCPWKPEWKVATKDNMWIKIKCPEPIRIHKFAVKNADGNVAITQWKLEASNNDLDWTPLFQTDTTSRVQPNRISNNLKYFYVPATYIKIIYFRLTIIDCAAVNPGLNFFQLYTLDEVVTI